MAGFMRLTETPRLALPHFIALVDAYHPPRTAAALPAAMGLTWTLEMPLSQPFPPTNTAV